MSLHRKLPKEKRDKLIAIAVGAVVLTGAIFFTLIDAQQETLAATLKQTEDERAKVSRAQLVVEKGGTIKRRLSNSMETLRKHEEKIGRAHV